MSMHLTLLGLGGSKKPAGTAGDRIHVTTAGEESTLGTAKGVAGGLLGWANDNNWLGAHMGGLFGSGGLFDRNGGTNPGSGISTSKPNESGAGGIFNAVGKYATQIAGGAIGAGGPGADGTFGGGALPDSPAANPFAANANGGLLSANTWSLVGENGPELAQVGSTSRINNARDTADILGGKGDSTTNHVWHIDATGSNDPAAVHAAVQRGILAAAPHIAAAGNNASSDHNRRVPASKAR